MRNVIYFEIQAENVQRAISFYETIFNWRFIKEVSLPLEYWRIQSDGINGGLLQRPNQTPPQEYGTNAFVCSVEVENYDEIAQKILQAGGIVALKKFAVPGKCWQGYFIDTEGNTFGLIQIDETAV